MQHAMNATYYRTDHHFWDRSNRLTIVQTFQAAQSAAHARALSRPVAVEFARLDPREVAHWLPVTIDVPGVVSPRGPRLQRRADRPC